MSERYREDQHVPCARPDSHQRSSAVKRVSKVLRPACSHLLSREGVFACAVVASYGHVLLIFDHRDWQRCRSILWSDLGITGEQPRTLDNCHLVCLLVDSHRHRSFTLVWQARSPCVHLTKETVSRYSTNSQGPQCDIPLANNTPT